MRKYPLWLSRTIKACTTGLVIITVLGAAGFHMSKDASERARNHLKNFRPDLAVNTLENVAWFRFWDADYYELRGQAHLEMGEFKEAANALTLGIALAPERAKLYEMRASAYESMGMMDKGKVAELKVKRFASLPAYARNAFNPQYGSYGMRPRMHRPEPEPIYTPSQTELLANQEAAIEADVMKVKRALPNPDASWVKTLERDLEHEDNKAAGNADRPKRAKRHKAERGDIVPAVNLTDPDRVSRLPNAG